MSVNYAFWLYCLNKVCLDIVLHLCNTYYIWQQHFSVDSENGSMDGKFHNSLYWLECLPEFIMLTVWNIYLFLYPIPKNWINSKDNSYLVSDYTINCKLNIISYQSNCNYQLYFVTIHFSFREHNEWRRTAWI